jgi:hypothetical protein
MRIASDASPDDDLDYDDPEDEDDEDEEDEEDDEEEEGTWQVSGASRASLDFSRAKYLCWASFRPIRSEFHVR